MPKTAYFAGLFSPETPFNSFIYAGTPTVSGIVITQSKVLFQKHKMRVLAALFLILLMPPAMARADQLQDGFAAFDRREYDTAFKLLKPFAEQGNAKAQDDLGFMFWASDGVKRDWAEADKWWREAAEQGNADAQFNLARQVENGNGVKQDYAEALKWYRMAADQGHAEAPYWIGNMYRARHGVTGHGGPDLVKAYQWFRLSADRGYAQAQFSLGCMYYDGEGVKRDYAEALKWWSKAAEQNEQFGSYPARWRIGEMYRKGEGVKQDYVQAYMWWIISEEATEMPGENVLEALAKGMTPEQVAQAKRLAAEWKPVVARKTKEDVWKDWWAESRRQCPGNHLDWIPDGSYLDLLGDFDKTLSHSLQQQASTIEDYDHRCSMERMGFACEMSVSLDAFIRLGLLRRFTAFGCQHYKCEEPSLCMSPKL